MEVRSARRFHFDAEPAEVWAALASVEEYPQWWPWLQSFEAQGLVQGDRWRCTVKPPLPYVVRFTVHLDEVIAEQSIRATVAGDIAGQAQLSLEPAEDGSTMILLSKLTPASPTLKVMGTIGRPLVRYGHDWVLDAGAGQFASRAL